MTRILVSITLAIIYTIKQQNNELVISVLQLI